MLLITSEMYISFKQESKKLLSWRDKYLKALEFNAIKSGSTATFVNFERAEQTETGLERTNERSPPPPLAEEVSTLCSGFESHQEFS